MEKASKSNKRRKTEKATVVVEYASLVILLLAALVVMQRYIINGFLGKWKEASDAVGHGRQYDPRPFGVAGEEGGTLECYYYYNQLGDNPDGFWMDKEYYDDHCRCQLPPGHVDFATHCVPCRMPGYASRALAEIKT